MTATTTPFGPDFVKDLIPQILRVYGDAVAHAYRIVWDAAWQIALQHLISIGAVLFIILLLSAIRAFTTGRWGWFGSVLYNYLYFGVLILIGWIFGPEIYANDYFEIVLVLLYVTCFTLVGVIIRKTGLRRW